LKIPARAPFVVVAKRAASALGSAAGFSLEGIDDLNIAVAQACEKAIAAAERMWGASDTVLKIGFRLVEGGMEVEVKSQRARDALADETALRKEVEASRRDAAALRQAARRLSQEVAVEREERIRAQRRAAAWRVQPVIESVDYDEVAVNMIRMFVDELRYNVDSHGSLRMRMVKYLVD
jgi:anti-sigma regulatory factor (Ser/Thr protein kinase)